MYIYSRIRDMRVDNSLSQAKIAEILGTTQQQYSKWERGEQEIPVHHLITLARLYKVSIYYLVGISKNK